MKRLLMTLLVAWLASSCFLFRPRPPHYEPFLTESGLRVQDLVVPDEGVRVQLGDQVTIEYVLRLADGTVVDSSIERGQPIIFEVGAGEVPAGLEEGLLGMRELGRRRIDCPPELGYGAEGMPPEVPPDAALVFEVELIAVDGAGAPADAEPADAEPTDAEPADDEDDGPGTEQPVEGPTTDWVRAGRVALPPRIQRIRVVNAPCQHNPAGLQRNVSSSTDC